MERSPAVESTIPKFALILISVRINKLAMAIRQIVLVNTGMSVAIRKVKVPSPVTHPAFIITDITPVRLAI